MVWPFGKTASEEQLAAIKSRCRQFDKAIEVCRKANGKDSQYLCNALTAQSDLCRGGVVCPEAAESFRECQQRVGGKMVSGSDGGSAGNCTKELGTLRKCLRKYSLAS